MKAVIYARYSTDKQREESSEDQFRECEDVCQREDFQIVARYADPEISGGTADRPDYQAMLAAARRHEFDVIVAEDVERLWRNRTEYGPRSAEWEDLGIQMVTATGDDTRRDGWSLLIQIKMAMAEHSRRQSSYRSRRGARGNAERGNATGGCPYGYRSVVRPNGTKWLEVVEDEAEVVRRIFRMFAEGAGGKQIAVALNEDRVPSPAKHWNRSHRRTDGLWHPSAIVGDPKKFVGILCNETYIGRLIWNRTTWIRSAQNSKKRRRVTHPRDKWIITDAPELLIVDDELWQQVQGRIRATQERTEAARTRAAEAIEKGHKRRNRTGAYHSVAAARPGRPAPYLLSGLLKCGNCGSNFIMSDGRKYGCATRINCGKVACSNGARITRTEVEQLLLASLRDELLNGEYLKVWTAEVAQQVREVQSQPQPGERTRQRLAEVEAGIERVVNALASGLMGSDAVAAKLKELEAEKAQLITQLAALADPMPLDVSATLKGSAADFARMVEELPAKLTDPSVVYGARDAIKDWMGEVRIEPGADGPLAFWRLNTEGLLVTAGPQVANVVAGVGFEPTTFGL